MIEVTQEQDTKLERRRLSPAKKMLLLAARWQRLAIVVIVLLALAGVLWTAGTIGWGNDKSPDEKHTAMVTYSVTNSGYSYSMQFYENARTVSQSEGVQAVAVTGKAIA